MPHKELRIPTSHSPHSAIKHTLLANKPHPPTLHTLPPELIRHILSFTLDHPTSGPNTTLRQMLATSNALFETYRRDRVVTDCVAVVLAERAVGIMSRNRTACTKSATKASTSKPPTTSETVAEDILLDLARELRVACVDAMIQRIGEGDGRARGVVKMLGNYRGMAVGLMGTSEGGLVTAEIEEGGSMGVETSFGGIVERECIQRDCLILYIRTKLASRRGLDV